jgi:predicted Zn-dependent protease with MMP-like domain
MTSKKRHGPGREVGAALERAWTAYDEGDLEGAMAEVSGVLRRDPRNPDALLMRAACRLDEGDPEAALEDLEGAGQASDPAMAHLTRAMALYDLARVAEARAEVEQALQLEPEWCEAHYELARVLDHLGDEVGARRHYTRAHRIHPEEHPEPLEMSDAEFDRLVVEALAELPDAVTRVLEDVHVEVMARPSQAMLEGSELSPDLLGLFVGRNRLERRVDDVPGLPDAIYLFRRNLLRVCHDRDELAEQVRITVQHEVAHLIGADEGTVDDWGLA